MKPIIPLKLYWKIWISKKFSEELGVLKRTESLRFSMVGLILGGTTLITVLSVMNGFQKRFHDNLREISYFHGRIQQTEPSFQPPTLPQELKVTLLFPFTETPILIQSQWTQPMPAIVKGIQPNLFKIDSSYFKLIKLQEGSWNLKKGEVLIGERLAYVLGVKIGDSLDITSLRALDFNLRNPILTQVKVSGIWESDYYDLNRYTLFMMLEDSLETITQIRHLLWGIKVKNLSHLLFWQKTYKLKEGNLTTWLDENSAFFQALNFEKRAMTTLLTIIFIIVGLNTYYSLREKIIQHQKDISILKSLGASPSDCQFVFIQEGIFIGFFGGILGVILGLTLSLSINVLISFLEKNLNYFLIWAAGDLLEVSPPLISFSLAVEGASQLPLSIYWSDVILIFSLIFFSTFFFSWVAIQSITKNKPSRSMRYSV